MEIAPGQEFWIVATGCQTQGSQQEKNQLFDNLKSEAALSQGRNQASIWKFDVPDGEHPLQFGSFDNLIRLTDDLQKHDQQVDGILHRLERQYLEMTGTPNFLIKSQKMESKVDAYIKSWKWDEAKYPKTRAVMDLLTSLIGGVSRLDDECRNKTIQYNELKTQKANLVKKDIATLAARDLMDVITPDVVDIETLYVSSEHMATLAVIIPRGADKDFLSCYERFAENVVPMSAQKFRIREFGKESDIEDKDGNSLWRVVMFKSAVEPFKKACREHPRRFVCKDVNYSRANFDRLQNQRAQIAKQVEHQHNLVTGLYAAAWSDVFIAMMHIKAMRVFVEGVLRFGIMSRFACFLVTPRSGQGDSARRALAKHLGKAGGALGQNMGADLQDDGDEYFPYVSFSFTPFAASRN